MKRTLSFASVALALGCGAGSERIDAKAAKVTRVPVADDLALAAVSGAVDEAGGGVFLGSDGQAKRVRLDGTRAALEPHPGNAVQPDAVSAIFAFGPHVALVAAKNGLFVAQAGWIVVPPWRDQLPAAGLVGVAVAGGTGWIAHRNGLYRLVDGQLGELKIEGGKAAGLTAVAVVPALDGTSTLYFAQGKKLWRGSPTAKGEFTLETVGPAAADLDGDITTLVGLPASPAAPGELWGLAGGTLFRVAGGSTRHDAGDPVNEIAGSGRSLWIRAGGRLLRHDADAGIWTEASGVAADKLLAADATGTAWARAKGRVFGVSPGAVPRIIGLDQNMRLHDTTLTVRAIFSPGSEPSMVTYKIGKGAEVMAKPPLFSLGGVEGDSDLKPYSLASLSAGIYTLTATARFADGKTAVRAVPFELRPAAGSAISFESDIQPINTARCARCHTRGPGPTLAGYEQWKASAAKIVAAVRDRRMPADGPLDPTQIEKIERWASAGAPP